MSRYVLLFVCVMVSVLGCRPSPQTLKLTGMQGSAIWNVTLTQTPSMLTPQALQEGLETRIRYTNQLIGTWDKQAEISRFNQAQTTDWYPVSSELAQLLQTLLSLSRESAGRYDVTLRPLLKLWGFQNGELSHANVPTAEVIATTLQQVGYQKLAVRLEPPALRKASTDLSIELASIADGFATDQMGAYLESLGIQDYMVEIAGEVRARGKSPRGDAWRIAIEKPVELGRVIQQGVALQNQALATSGDYRNFFINEGKRYSHTLDATTGYPVQSRLASVSVIADSGLLADAYATLLLALGETEGKAFAEQYQLAAYFIWRTEQGFEAYSTPHFKPYLLNQR